jgi:hypothetical protein
MSSISRNAKNNKIKRQEQGAGERLQEMWK